MPQPTDQIPTFWDRADVRVGRFQRYARGRIAHFGKRQILTVVGSGSVAVLTTPYFGLLVLVIALCGELLDCINLRKQLWRLEHGGDFKTINASVTATAGAQAASTSTCILLVDILPDGGGGLNFALIFLLSAALNAGLVWPYHRSSAVVRMGVYFFTLLVILFVQFERSEGVLNAFIADLLTMSMMTYIVYVVVQYVIIHDAKHQRNTHQIFTTSKALEASNKLKNESQDQARKLALVARHANDSILISDLNGRITWVNEAFSKITGYTRSEALGRTPAELLNDDLTNPEVTEKIRRHIQAGKPIRAEVLNRRKDGTKIWVETNIVPIRMDDGAVEMIVAIERDITAIKAHEQELADAKILAEKGERAKSEFLATMSHEIRTPMNGIIGLSDLLSGLKLSKEAQTYAKTINESADALLSIINDILDVSKLDAGQLTIEPVEFDLKSCFCNSVEFFAPQVTKKGIYLDVIQDESFPSDVIGDSGRIRQILLNVIGNAVKFTSHGGVTLKVGVRDTEHGYRLKIDVTDTGIGVPEERTAQIFDKFQQADSQTTRKFGGTGLGLSISRQLAQLMNGNIVVQSELGKGSTFSITLNLGRARLAQNTQKVPIIGMQNISPMSILVAEDNKTNRFLISKYLKDLPLDVHFSHDGKEAVENARELLPDLIFMDMSMPEMDGLEATRQIRAQQQVQPRIIALTANAFASDRKACFDAGMDDFLAKPVKKAELLLKLSELSSEMAANQL